MNTRWRATENAPRRCAQFAGNTVPAPRKIAAAEPGAFLSGLDLRQARMRTILLMIAELYRMEKLGRGRRGATLGTRPARPAGLGKLHTYLLEIREQLLPKSEAGQAVNYVLRTALTRLLWRIAPHPMARLNQLLPHRWTSVSEPPPG